MKYVYVTLISLGAAVVVNELTGSLVINNRTKLNIITSRKCKKIYMDMMTDLGIDINKLINGTYIPLPGEIKSFVKEYALRTSGRNLLDDLDTWGY